MLKNKKLQIQYPCDWEYRVIGESEELLREVIFSIMPREYNIKFGNNSSSGKFISLHISLQVHSESERNELFIALKNSEHIKMVL